MSAKQRFVDFLSACLSADEIIRIKPDKLSDIGGSKSDKLEYLFTLVRARKHLGVVTDDNKDKIRDQFIRQNINLRLKVSLRILRQLFHEYIMTGHADAEGLGAGPRASAGAGGSPRAGPRASTGAGGSPRASAGAGGSPRASTGAGGSPRAGPRASAGAGGGPRASPRASTGAGKRKRRRGSSNQQKYYRGSNGWFDHDAFARDLGFKDYAEYIRHLRAENDRNGRTHGPGAAGSGAGPGGRSKSPPRGGAGAGRSSSPPRGGAGAGRSSSPPRGGAGAGRSSSPPRGGAGAGRSNSGGASTPPRRGADVGLLPVLSDASCKSPMPRFSDVTNDQYLKIMSNFRNFAGSFSNVRVRDADIVKISGGRFKTVREFKVFVHPERLGDCSAANKKKVADYYLRIVDDN